ncbi:hypothetical protein SUGI_0636800 [Cryptomeria japonica]|nr:hypothetical protein SUGI_0636800 [Cryptomeria japonica]
MWNKYRKFNFRTFKSTGYCSAPIRNWLYCIFIYPMIMLKMDNISTPIYCKAESSQFEREILIEMICFSSCISY